MMPAQLGLSDGIVSSSLAGAYTLHRTSAASLLTHHGMRLIRVPRECPADIATLIEACMEGEASRRPTAKQIIAQLSTHVPRK